MLIFVTAITVALVVSFLCSIFESVLLSLTRPQVELMVSGKKPGGRLLSKFKDNMDIPIAAILILNTAAHTIGTAVAGASYSNVFDPATLWIFSIVFTLAVLLFTEIIPKTLGVAYSQALASPVAFGDRLECRLRRGFKCARVEGDVHGGVDAARADHAIVRMNDDPGPSQSSSRGAACGTRSHCRPVSEPGK